MCNVFYGPNGIATMNHPCVALFYSFINIEQCTNLSGVKYRIRPWKRYLNSKMIGVIKTIKASEPTKNKSTTLHY